jgi:HTH-type transcriptional regulator, cell division transcriptional repressor
MLAGLLNVSIRWLLTGEGDGISGPGEAEVPRRSRRFSTNCAT